MARIIYNKLVRDLIPDIIEKSGKRVITEILSEEQYRISLDEKLKEELEEYQTSKDIEELADVLEVMYAIVEAKGLTPLDLEMLRKEKAAQRGAFRNKIFLKEVQDGNE